MNKKIGRGNNRIRKELHAIKIMNERKKMSKKNCKKDNKLDIWSNKT